MVKYIILLITGIFILTPSYSIEQQSETLKTDYIIPILKDKKRPLRVAIIDTGFNITMERYKRLCKSNSLFDVTGEGMEDVKGHGTMMSDIIDSYAHQVNYCQIIVKYYRSFNRNYIFDPLRIFINKSIISTNNFDDFQKALEFVAFKLKNIDILHISIGGNGYVPAEKIVIKHILKRNIVIVAAAGNDNVNLNEIPYYPASYDKRIWVIGNSGSSTSNYGDLIDRWENVRTSKIPTSGTSGAAAMFTGKIIKANGTKK